MVINLIALVVSALLVEWAMIINVNRPHLEPRSAKILAIIFAVALLIVALGIVIWI